MKYDKRVYGLFDKFFIDLYDGSISIEMAGVGGCPKFSIKDYPKNYIYLIAYGKHLLDSTDCLIIYSQHYNKTIKEQKRHIKQYIKTKRG